MLRHFAGSPGQTDDSVEESNGGEARFLYPLPLSGHGPRTIFSSSSEELQHSPGAGQPLTGLEGGGAAAAGARSGPVTEGAKLALR